MGRQRRPFLPGGIFHLTARTIRRERRLTPRLRSAALHALTEVVPRSGARVLAVAIMANHLHLIARQGERPLASLMQPLLRRLARRVQDAHGLEGPIFWRPYACEPCLDPWHARNAIVYTHLNPVRAGVCGDPSRYRWTSHALYVGEPTAALPPEVQRLAGVLDPALAMPLFATGPRRTTEQLREDYRAFVERRLIADAAREDGDAAVSETELAQPPGCPWWDPAWGASLSPLFHSSVRGDRSRNDDRPAAYVPDMTSIAQAVIALEAPGRGLSFIRGRGGGRERTRTRHLVIRRLHAAGYPNVQIARFVDLSESGVSYVLCGRPQKR